MRENNLLEVTNDFIIKKDYSSNYSDFKPSRKNGYKILPNETINKVMYFLASNAYEVYLDQEEIVVGHHDEVDYYTIKKIDVYDAEDILERNGYDYEDMIYSELDYKTLDELYNQAKPLTSDELFAIADKFTYVFDDDYEQENEL